MVRLAGRVAEAGGASGLIQAFKDQLREQTLASNRSKPIGSGAYGVVYESNIPGNIMKQHHWGADAAGGADLVNEANLQALASELGIAPKIAAIETFPGGVGNRVEMEDIRRNFEPHKGRKIAPDQPGRYPTGMDAVRVNQQLGQLALKGIDLGDRHSGNVVYNKMTGRPMQLDFGIATKVEGEMQVDALTRATTDGFTAAGLGDIAEIFHDTVYDLLAGGQVAEAMDVAKQGFSRLQKIRRVNSPVDQLVDKVKKESDLFDVISPY
tara:strand:- start:303 stop:1103 length:801 start_codon:yes stop_codon:yes gene_type:complete